MQLKRKKKILPTTLKEDRYTEKFINKHLTKKGEYKEGLTVIKKPLFMCLQLRGSAPGEILIL